MNFKVISHISAVVLACVYAGINNGTTAHFGEFAVEGFWAGFATYMMMWFLIGGVIEFVTDLAKPLINKFIR